MISFENISKSYGAQVIVRDETSFLINTGDRCGIVGPNGTGKSTLFRMISGEESPDSGTITMPKNSRLGYLKQSLDDVSDTITVLDYTSQAIPDMQRIEESIKDVEDRMVKADDEEKQKLILQHGRLMEEFEHLGGYEMQVRAEAALSGLGFDTEEFSRPFKTFSGGWQMRSELARTLISKPDILLLDEPSNYLDVPAIEWLQRFLRDYEGTMLLISHDRYLLRSLTTSIVEINWGIVTSYNLSFGRYTEARDSRRDQLMAAKKNQDRKVEKINQFVDRFRAKNTKASQAQSRLKQLEKMDIIEVPEDGPNLSRIRVAEPPHCGSEIMTLEGAGLSYDGEHYILKDVDLRINRGDKTAVVGFNGMGKTTLLRLLAGQHEPTKGTRRLGHKVVIGYQSQDFTETMAPGQSVYQVIREAKPNTPEQQIRSILGTFGFPAESIKKSVDVLSGGEKIRLAFARIFINPPNFLILDEPTTHLDIDGRKALEEAVKQYNGTICFVSHDIDFVKHVAESIIAISPGNVQVYPGDYDYYVDKCRSDSTETVYEAGAQNSSTPDLEPAGKQRREDKKKSQKDIRELKKRIREIEKSIESLDNEQSDIHTKMSDADYFKTDASAQAADKERLAQIASDLEGCYSKWQELDGRIESSK